MSTTHRMSLIEALDCPQGIVDELGAAELALTAAEVRRAGRLWLALLGTDDDGSEAARLAWAEVAADPALCVALSRPAAEFLAWWRAEDWATFEPWHAAGPDGSAWGWLVLGRAVRGFELCGPMATQVPLHPELVRP